MYNFSIHQERKMGENSGIISRGFWCGIMNICNIKLFHDALKTKEKHTF
jgi:hypothetical protein